METPADHVFRRSPSNGRSNVTIVVVALAIVFANRASMRTADVESR